LGEASTGRARAFQYERQINASIRQGSAMRIYKGHINGDEHRKQ